MLKLNSAVSGSDSNFPSPPANIVLGWALTVGEFCAITPSALKSTSSAIEIFMVYLVEGYLLGYMPELACLEDGLWIHLLKSAKGQ